jgi:glutathione transport system substrate-binding protein
MGAGPYKFVEYKKGQRIVIEKSSSFYKSGIPKTDRIEFQFLADGNTRVNSLLSGDVDLIEYVPWKDVPTIKGDSNLQVLGGTGPFMGLIFNTTFKPFSDPRVRRAVAFAIDRTAIIKTAFAGQGTPIYGMAVPTSSIAYNSKFDSYFKLSLDEAKKLLADAGYPNGSKARCWQRHSMISTRTPLLPYRLNLRRSASLLN